MGRGRGGVVGCCVSAGQDWTCRVRGGPGKRQEKKRQRGRQYAGLAAAPWLSPGPRNLWVPSKCPSDAPTDPVTGPEAAVGRPSLSVPFSPPWGVELGLPTLCPSAHPGQWSWVFPLWMFGGVDGSQPARKFWAKRGGEQRDSGSEGGCVEGQG